MHHEARTKLSDCIELIESKDPAFKKIPTLCYLPFMHIEASATGDCKQCCMAENPIFKEYSELSDKEKHLAYNLIQPELPDELQHPAQRPLQDDDLSIEKILAIGEKTQWHRMGNDLPTVWHLSESTLADVFQSQYMKKLREDFLAGKKPHSCKKCWDEEDAGIKSKRIHWAEMFAQHPNISNTIFEDDITEESLQYLDLKLGTICNLKCRICGSASSSKWSQDEMDMANEFENVPKEHLKRTMAYKRLKLGNWPRENQAFWTNLADDILPNIVHLEFTGGEPWLIQEHFDFLQIAIDKGYAKNIDLHYNTNGTQLPKHALEEIWPHFKWVKTSFSIDDVGERFEYQRFGAKWEEVNYNINYLCDNKFLNMDTEVCTTVNLMNIKNLPAIFEWIRTTNIDLWYLNLMHMPYHFNISILPESYKEQITYLLTNYLWDQDDLLTSMQTGRQPFIAIDSTRKYSRNKTLKDGKDYIPEILSIVEYMNTHQVEDVDLARNQLHDLIYKIDFIRKQKLEDVDPELVSAIGYSADTMRIAWPSRTEWPDDPARTRHFKQHGWDKALLSQGHSAENG